MIHGVGTAKCSTESFCKQVDYLHKKYEIISLNEAIGGGQRPAGSNETRVVLTFDDGLRNMFLQAYPFLEKHRIPFTVFICPGLIDKNAWLWNHECRARLAGLTKEKIFEIGVAVGAGNLKAEPFIEWMKKLPLGLRMRVEDVIRNATPDFCPMPEQHRLYDLMSWEELGQLDPALVTIGAHTMHHPILTSLNSSELNYEIVESRRRIEEALGIRVKHFCFPNGNYDPVSLKIVTKHFASAVTTTRGAVKADTSLGELPRIKIAKGVCLIAWRMHCPWL
jgi:peptidoglycan/xylan/chitin deacetylase (PgdA/CDA1 family)